MSTPIFAQNLQTYVGKNGIFILFGKNIPANFTYQLERKMASSTEWEPVNSITVDRSAQSLLLRLRQAHRKNSFYEVPSDTIFKRFTNLMSRAIISDSLYEFNASPLMLETAGLGYFDTEIQTNQTYQYRLTSNSPKVSEQASAPIRFVVQKPKYELVFNKSVPEEDLVGLEWRVSKRSNLPFSWKVYRQYYLQTSMQEIPVIKFFTASKDSVILRTIDRQTSAKRLYRYVIVPYDAFGNEGTPSDTILVKNVKPYSDIPILEHFTADSDNQRRGILLKWSFDKATALKDLQLYRSKSFEGPYQSIATLQPTDTTYLDSKVEPIETYFYYLKMNSLYNQGYPSVKVAGMLQGIEQAVLSPKNLAIKQQGTIVTLSWTRSERNTRGYYVYRGEGYKGKQVQVSDLIYSKDSLVSYTDNIQNLDSTQVYSYSVVSFNTSYNTSPNSSSVYTVPSAALSLPTPIGLAAYRQANNKVLLIWKDMTVISPYVVGYELYRREVNPTSNKALDDYKIIFQNSVADIQNSFVDSLGIAGKSYEYAVKSIGHHNFQSAMSASTTILLNKVLPPPPAGLKVITDNQSIIVEWDNPAIKNLKNYKVYRFDSQSRTPLLVQTLPVGINTYKDSGLPKGKDYFYKVSVVDSQNQESILSDEVGISWQ